MGVDDDPNLHTRDELENLQTYKGGGDYWDEITGEVLPKELTRAARMEELTFMKSWQVWDTVPVSLCWKALGKPPLGGKWVDVNKGDSDNPLIRSRYVAKEIAMSKDLEFFAATPPLEALRMLLSMAATGGARGSGKKLMVLDARKAHLHAMCEREVYVQLPPEVAAPGMCARLRRCLYGTRDAPARWEAFAAEQLEEMGFSRGHASSCAFWHAARGVACMVHGDDFVFLGRDKQLDEVKAEMESRFLIKCLGRLGGEKGDIQEIRVLNRVIRWTPQGLLYEADPRHVEILLQQGGANLRAVSTPMVKTKTEKRRFEEEADIEDASEEGMGEELTEAEVRWFRSLAARANYLAMDRPDLSFAAKELCRRMSCPRASDAASLQRLIQYLSGAGRVVYRYTWQSSIEKIAVYSDTDYAGCSRTRKSTSGGVALIGSHLIKHWSATQRGVTLSSAEAELGGIVKSAGEGIGLRSLAQDLGATLALELHADSSAAIGICKRTGIGKVRHLAVGQLWVQERVRTRDFRLYKVLGTANPADALTKSLARETLDGHIERMGLTRAGGRAESAPKLVCALFSPGQKMGRLTSPIPTVHANLVDFAWDSKSLGNSCHGPFHEGLQQDFGFCSGASCVTKCTSIRHLRHFTPWRRRSAEL